MIDELMPAMDAAEQQWGSPTIERNGNTIELAFQFRPPFVCDPGPSSYEVAALELSFRTDLDYTPSRLRESLKIRTGEEWQIETRLDDFVRFGEIQYPRSVQGYDPEVTPMKLGYSEITSLIAEVPKEEVIRRTEMAYWEMMQIDERRRHYRWYFAAGLIVVGLGLWRWQVRKGRQ